jgi:6-phosphogluconolactonase (cycloisomerase 2 family)
LSVPSGSSFTFATALASGVNYAVTVKTQPTNPSQSCSVTNGSGPVANANVTTVAISCQTIAYTVGGSVSGLSGSGLVLQDNGGSNLSVTSSGTFTFGTSVNSGANYLVTVKTQPTNPAQLCTVSNGSGPVTTAPITTVSISCVTNTYTIGGTVIGNNGTGLVLQDNGSDNLSTFSVGGGFTFATKIASGANFAVTVYTQPTSTPAQYCTVSNGSGTVAAAPVTNVTITCRNTGQYVYVTTTNGGTKGVITMFSIDPTNGTLERDQRFATSAIGPGGVALDTSGQYAYVSYIGSGDVATETIDTSNGLFTETGSASNATGTAMYTATADPTAAYLYTAGLDPNGVDWIYAYSISAGSLTALSTPQYAAGNTTNDATMGVAIDSTGTYLYSANCRDGTVSGYTINSNGSLSAITGSPFQFQGGAPTNIPSAVAIYPAGGYLYVTDSAANTVTAYSYNLAGALTEVGTPQPVGTSPTGVAIDPTGSFLYVANSGNGTVSTFTINSSTGALTVVGSPVSTGGGSSTSPTALLVEPSGQFLYVTNGDAATVSAFSITPVTGVLSVLSGSPLSAVGGFGGSGGSSALAIE